MKCSGMASLLLLLSLALSTGNFAIAQDSLPPPGFFDDIIQQMKFERPTRIVGRFRSLDGYEDAIWIDWTHVNDGVRWRPVSREMIFKVLPRDAGMMDFLRMLKQGTSLHMTIQMAEDGNRHILELDGT